MTTLKEARELGLDKKWRDALLEEIAKEDGGIFPLDDDKAADGSRPASEISDIDGLHLDDPRVRAEMELVCELSNLWQQSFTRSDVS